MRAPVECRPSLSRAKPCNTEYGLARIVLRFGGDGRSDGKEREWEEKEEEEKEEEVRKSIIRSLSSPVPVMHTWRLCGEGQAHMMSARGGVKKVDKRDKNS